MGNSDFLKAASNIGNMGKKVFGDMKINSEIGRIRSRQDEHKYNIGKMILEKEIKTEDSLINSNIKTIKDIMKG